MTSSTIIADEPPPSGVAGHLRRLGPLVSLVLLAGAMALLHHELRRHHPRDILHAIQALPLGAIVLALALTVVGYLILPAYDALALRYVGHDIGPRRTWFTGFVAYAFSQTLGLPLLTGGSVRYRLYSTWGLSGVEVAQVIAFAGLTFWMGVITLAGTTLTIFPAQAAATLGLPSTAALVLGLALLTVSAAYVMTTILRRRPVRLFGWRIQPPAPRLAGWQLLVGCLDWTVASLVLYVLLPSGAHVAYGGFLTAFLAAQVLGIVSHVPGGLGVFEGVLVLVFKGNVPAAALIGSLVVYRVVYYVTPFTVGAALLVTYEARQRREVVTRVARTVGRWVPLLAPRVLAVITFAAGALLLFSGALPAEGSRLRLLGDVLPLSVIELSHFLGSLFGAGLLILAWGIARRLDGAFHLSVALLAGGVLVSLLKGGDFEEATILSLVLVSLWPARGRFDRHASLLHEPFSAGWLMAIGMVVVSSVWLGMFAYRYVPYTGDLWWRFALRGDAPRFLRASVGVFAAGSVFGLARLLRSPVVEPALPTSDALQRALELMRGSSRTYVNLALLGDKALLFERGGAAFLMYSISRRSWIAMGDPIGAPAAFPDLVWEFRELADRYSGLTVFYQASPEHLPLYLELGLRPLKIGEEATISLADFSLEGAERRGLRRAHRQVEKAGCTFEIVPAAETPSVIPALRLVSDNWLARKQTREKGFSLGRFDPGYLSYFSIALVRRAGRIVAFANVWTTETHTEVSPDLMRYTTEAPEGVMDYLFVELLVWAKEHGYQRFDLGMAPLAGIEGRALAPLWSRMNALVYRHGEHFYNFQGLRRYKEKFHPDWSSRYLAAPSGLVLPRVLADTAALISGGLRGVVTR